MERQKSSSSPQGFLVESHDDYHANPAVGSSGIRLAYQCPKKFAYRYLNDEYEEKPSKAKDFGRLMHMALLEPQRTRERIRVGPANAPRNTNVGKAKWAEFEATLKPDDIVMDAKEADVVVPMINVLMGDRHVREMLAGGVAERSGYFTDPTTGLACKFRPDYFIEQTSSFIIIDYKTGRDVSYDVFQREIHTRGYHVQAAHYLAGAKLLTGKPGIFAWIAQEKEQPCVVGIYVATDPLLEIGEYQRMKGLTTIARCWKEGYWPGYHDGPMNMAPARWAEWQQLEAEEEDVNA